MGFSLDRCPSVHACCSCVPLRTGVAYIAVLGALWGALHVAAYTPNGAAALTRLGAPPSLAQASGTRRVHGVIGVLLCAAHVILAIAAAVRSDSLCELYVWAMMALWVVLLLLAGAASAMSAIAGLTVLAAILPLAALAIVLLSLYCTIVVANYRMTLP